MQALRPVPWRACGLVFVVALLFRLGWVVDTDQIHLFPRKEMVRIAMRLADRLNLLDLAQLHWAVRGVGS